jgi:hypothetical protein
MRAMRARTPWERMSRVVPTINWEVHVLQSGMDRFATQHPWYGLPLVVLALALIWGLYWLSLPVLLVLCLLARVLHSIQLWFRRVR